MGAGDNRLGPRVGASALTKNVAKGVIKDAHASLAHELGNVIVRCLVRRREGEAGDGSRADLSKGTEHVDIALKTLSIRPETTKHQTLHCCAGLGPLTTTER